MTYPPQQPGPGQSGYPQQPQSGGFPQQGPPSGGFQQPGQPQGYPQPGYPAQGGHPAPYGQEIDPETGQPLSEKTQLAAGLLSLFLGQFGAGRWYTGHVGIAVGQLLTCGGCGIWALIDGIMLLVNGGEDSEGRRLRKS